MNTNVIMGTVQFEVVAKPGGKIAEGMVLVGREPPQWSFPEFTEGNRVLFSLPGDAAEFLHGIGLDIEDFEIRPATNGGKDD